MTYGVLVLAGLAIVLAGYVLRGRVERCDECGDPMPEGYTGFYQGMRLCGKCCHRLRVPRWYDPQELQ